MKITKGMTLIEAKDTIGEAYRDFTKENCLKNDGLWAALTINTDGEIVSRCEASPCYSESEYYGRDPHPATIATMRRNFNGEEKDLYFEGNWCDEVEFMGWEEFKEQQDNGSQNYEADLEAYLEKLI